MVTQVDIPHDIYESAKEIVIIIPLGGVKKSSIDLTFSNYKLLLSATREIPSLSHLLLPKEQGCFWGEMKTIIDLPPGVYREYIHSTITPENILIITIPKRLDPDSLKIDVLFQ